MAGNAKFHDRQQVWWIFRSGKGYGVIHGAPVRKTGSPDKWLYEVEVNSIDRAAHKGEPLIRRHTGADLHPWNGKLPAKVKAQAAKRKKQS